MKALFAFGLFAAALSSGAHASNRDSGWEFGAAVLYQDGTELSFDGGSSAKLEDEFGLEINFGYRFNNRFELQFGVNWQSVDYDVTIQSVLNPDLQFRGTGEMEVITPNFGVNFNFLESPLTPYLNAMVGWSFVDTNIPDGPVQVGCWWDPWWGQICAPYQSTRSIDDPMYQVGVGLRWDVSPGYTLRLGYEKQWFDYSNATTTPEFDQFKLGIAFRY